MGIKGYKGFDHNFACKGKQYSENTIFEEDKAEVCHSGMHFCINPFDVLDYYPLLDCDCNMNTFAKVEALDDAVTDDNIKYAAKKLSIGAKIDWEELTTDHIKYVHESTIADISDTQVGSSGNGAKIGSSGDYAKIGSSGNGAKIGSSGDYAKIGSSGDYAQISSSGNGAKIGSSGDDAQIGSSGNGAKIGSSGDDAQIGSFGNGAKIGSSGDYAKIGSSGNYAKIGSSGYRAQISSEGMHSVICCAGNRAEAKAKIGSWITLAEWENNVPICVKTEQVDGEKIKEDTWYTLKNGEFQEVEI